MGSYDWVVTSRSLLAFVVGAGTAFGWPLRLAQGALAIGAGIAVARAARRSAHAVWLIPFAVAAARLALDPLVSDYYFAALEGPALCGAALLAARGLPLRDLRRESLA